MITSSTEMLELPNFGHMTTSTIWFESLDKFFGDVIDRNYDVITFISRRPKVAIFAAMFKIITIFLKTISKKVSKKRPKKSFEK